MLTNADQARVALLPPHLGGYIPFVDIIGDAAADANEAVIMAIKAMQAVTRRMAACTPAAIMHSTTTTQYLTEQQNTIVNYYYTD